MLSKSVHRQPFSIPRLYQFFLSWARMSLGTLNQNAALKTMLCKVLEVTLFFWIIKILCTTS